MSCGCKDPKPEPEQLSLPYRVQASRLTITCTCGITRLIPEEVQEGDIFQLIPCPRCGTPLRGRLVGDTVEADG